MEKQICIIHGGTTFNNREEFVDFLKTREVSAANFKPAKGWQTTLADDLWDDFEIFEPQMPNKQNACYEEWKIWLERMIPFFNDGMLFVGHSLGGIFLAKYLSENVFSKKIGAVMLVAPPFDTEGMNESLADFILPESLTKFSEQVSDIYLIFSEDDPVVPFTQLAKYQKALPNAVSMTFEQRGHFRQVSFSELRELIWGTYRD